MSLRSTISNSTMLLAGVWVLTLMNIHTVLPDLFGSIFVLVMFVVAINRLWRIATGWLLSVTYVLSFNHLVFKGVVALPILSVLFVAWIVMTFKMFGAFL